MTAEGINMDRWDEQTYLTDRVDDQLSFYEKAATKAKKTYSRMQKTIIILGVLVPVVINIPSSWNGIADMAIYVQILVTIMSLTLAIFNGLVNFGKHQDLWLSYRMTEELLKHEKFLFLTGAGAYRERDSSFAKFVQKIESILSAEHNKFRSLIEDSKRPAAEHLLSDTATP